MALQYLVREWKLSNRFWLLVLVAPAAAFLLVAIPLRAGAAPGQENALAACAPAVTACAAALGLVFFSTLSNLSYGFNFAVQMSVRRRDYVLSAFLLHVLYVAMAVAETLLLSLVFSLAAGERTALAYLGDWLPWIAAATPLVIGMGWLTGAVLQRFGVTAYTAIWMAILFGGMLFSRLGKWAYTDGAGTAAGMAVQGVGNAFLGLGMHGIQILMALAGAAFCLGSWAVQRKQEVR